MHPLIGSYGIVLTLHVLQILALIILSNLERSNGRSASRLDRLSVPSVRWWLLPYTRAAHLFRPCGLLEVLSISDLTISHT